MIILRFQCALGIGLQVSLRPGPDAVVTPRPGRRLFGVYADASARPLAFDDSAFFFATRGVLGDFAFAAAFFLATFFFAAFAFFGLATFGAPSFFAFFECRASASSRLWAVAISLSVA